MSELFERELNLEESGDLDRRAGDLREVMRQVIEQFKRVNHACASGPHAELNVQELRLVDLLGRGEPRMMRELSSLLIWSRICWTFASVTLFWEPKLELLFSSSIFLSNSLRHLCLSSR